MQIYSTSVIIFLIKGGAFENSMWLSREVKTKIDYDLSLFCSDRKMWFGGHVEESTSDNYIFSGGPGGTNGGMSIFTTNILRGYSFFHIVYSSMDG